MVVSLGFFALNVTAAVFMLLSVLVALGGSYSGMKAPRRAASRAMGWMLFGGAGGVSKTILGTQGGGLAVYIIAFFVALSNRSSTTGSSSFGY